MSYPVGNPEDRFSRDEAHFIIANNTVRSERTQNKCIATLKTGTCTLFMDFYARKPHGIN